MSFRIHLIPSHARSLTIAISLGAFVALWRLETTPAALDSTAAPRSEPHARTAARNFVLPHHTQTNAIEKSVELESIDPWIHASPRRAQLMSPEAMAGYEPILGALNLSPRQLSRIKQLIVERAESANDADQLGKEHRLSPGLTLALRNDAEAVFDSQLEATTGTENFQAVKEMLQLTPQLAEIADSIGHELARKERPLTAAQMLQLARLFKTAYASDSSAPNPQTGLNELDRHTLARASSILTPEQLDILP